MSDEITFWDENLEDGYYDLILKEGLKKNRGIQTNLLLIKIIIESISLNPIPFIK